MKVLLTIILLFVFLVVYSYGVDAEDYVKHTGGTIAKDLSNLTLEEIRAIFDGNDGWILESDPSMLTASQNAFLRDNEADGKPLGVPTGKRACVGSSTGQCTGA